MICNIVPLPNRKITGYVSTIQPLFIRKEAMEDTYGFGCDYDMEFLSDFHKYKTIERVGDYLIERIIYTQEPMFQIHKWWECHLPIYPIWSKMYKLPFGPHATIYRYLTGSSALTSFGCIETPLTQTIFTPVYKEMHHIGLDDIVDEKSKDLSRFVVPGDDDANMSMCMSAKDMINRTKEGEAYPDELADIWLDCNFEPKYLDDPYHRLFGTYPTANQLKSIIGPQYHMQPMPPAIDPFKLNAKTTFDYETQFGQGTIKDLMSRLEESGYTDIEMSIRRDKNGQCVIETNMQVMYLGPSTVYQRSDFVSEKDSLIRVFRSFASALIGMFPNPLGVSVIKTWNEEVFIIVHVNDKEDDKYFFDLAALSIGSPSFTDING